MKKKLLLATAGVIALGVTAASAADLGRRAAPYKAPPYQPPPFSWTGFYVGINGGGAWGRSDYSAGVSPSFDVSGGLVGGTLGYNWQTGPVVFGLEGDIDWAHISGSTTCLPAGLGVASTCDARNDWLGTVRGRLGYAFDRVMPYVTGGLAVGNIKTSIAGLGSRDETNAGWTLGGGVEVNITGPWSAKVEYLYVDLGRADNPDTPFSGSDSKFQTNIVRAGLNYHF
ncbi:MAG: porin family protein [Pseudolabrys sp.]|nr:porin family protein [Pseudolabrys sp.]